MDERHPKNIDTRPKRRKDKDNPYEIFSVGIETENPQYYIRFIDGLGDKHCIEIEKEMFDLLDRFELDDLSLLNEVDRHYEHSELDEVTLERRALNKPLSIEETVIQEIGYMELHTAIDTLPEKQRKRLKLYYFENLTYEEIAKLEGCKYQTIQESIYAALKKIKKILE